MHCGPALLCGTAAVPLVTKQGSQGLLVQSSYSLRVNSVCFLKSTSLTGYNLEGAESFICLGFCLFDYDRVEMRNIFLIWSCYSAAWRKPHPLMQF